METVFSYLIFFLQVETVTEMNDLFFWGGKTIPASKKDFLSSGNCFRLFRASFPQVETISENGWNKIIRSFYKWPFLISK